MTPPPDRSQGAGPSRPAAALPAASLLVVRDGPNGLEVLTVMRSRRMGFAAGMLAFPGGRVDAADGDVRLQRLIRSRSGLSRTHIAFRIAALRELFEEAGLLLACDVASGRPIGPGRARRLSARFRRRLHAGRLGLRKILERSGIALATDALVPFAHWITPAIAPKRFDTRFYLAPAPAGQNAEADGREALSLAWRHPEAVLGAWRAGDVTMMFPTRLNLVKLARAANVAEALAQARAAPAPTVTPTLAADGTRRLTIPAEAGFGVTHAEESDLDPLERKAVEAHLAALRDAE